MVLGWPRSLFGFIHTTLWKTWKNFLANLIVLQPYSFFKDRFQCRLWNHIIELCIFLILKFISLFCTLNVVPTREFMSCIGYLENIGSLHFANLPNWFTSHYAIAKKSRLLISPSISSEESLLMESYQAHSGRYVYCNLTFAQKFKVCRWQQISVVLFKVISSLCSLRKSLPNRLLNN